MELNVNTSIPAKESSLSISAIQAQLGFLMGKVLTIVEAVHSDKEQRKAVKDIVRSAFRDQSDWIFTLATRDRSGVSPTCDPMRDHRSATHTRQWAAQNGEAESAAQSVPLSNVEPRYTSRRD